MATLASYCAADAPPPGGPLSGHQGSAAATAWPGDSPTRLHASDTVLPASRDTARNPSDWPRLSNLSHLPSGRALEELPTAELQPSVDFYDTQPLPTTTPANPHLRYVRPRWGLSAEWLPTVEGVGITSYDVTVKAPTYPIYGPPPPFLGAGFSYTNVTADSAHGLPSDLYEYSLTASWMRRWSDSWLVRYMIGVSIATDGRNTSGDAWRFRGGVFAIYRPNDKWSWTFGALALGRNDLPVVPAVGAVWEPGPACRFELMLPRPKIAFLLVDNGAQQQWWYVGGGFDGGTWGIERPGGTGDQITYKDWRVVVGWESKPRKMPGTPFAIGPSFGVEFGYVFSREFEFDRNSTILSIADGWLLRATAKF